eukprot:15437685-Alexandrium_andersonii.AAC.1
MDAENLEQEEGQPVLRDLHKGSDRSVNPSGCIPKHKTLAHTHMRAYSQSVHRYPFLKAKAVETKYVATWCAGLCLLRRD